MGISHSQVLIAVWGDDWVSVAVGTLLFAPPDIALEKEMAAHSSVLAWKNPMDRGAWWATVCGVAKSRI